MNCFLCSPRNSTVWPTSSANLSCFKPLRVSLSTETSGRFLILARRERYSPWVVSDKCVDPKTPEAIAGFTCNRSRSRGHGGADEIAFVQVKSSADQKVLNDY